jgi:hypothetical protein
VPVTLKKGETLRYDGGDAAVVYSKNWQVVATIPLRQADWVLPTGIQTVQFDCRFEQAEDNAAARLEFVLTGPEEVIRWEEKR